MKKVLTAILIVLSVGVFGQNSVQFDTVYYTCGGYCYEMLLYGGDSIQINGQMFRFQGTTPGNNWQTDGAYYIKPDPDTKIIKYPGIPYWNHMMTLNTDGPVWFKKSDGTLRGKIMIPETIGGTETATITCEDGGIYIYETEGSDLSVTINYIDSIPAPVTFKNLGKNSVLTIESIESLPFDTAGKTSISLNFGDWVRITPAETRFITERNDNQNYDDTLTSHNERINDLVTGKRDLSDHDSLSTLDEKSYNSLTDKPTTWDWSNLTSVPGTFTPTTHTQSWSTITDQPDFIDPSDTVGMAKRAWVIAQDSLAKQGIRTEYVNHDSLVKSNLRTEYVNHDSLVKSTMRTWVINHDSLIKQGIRTEYINHDSLVKSGLRAEYVNHDSLVQQYARIRDALKVSKADSNKTSTGGYVTPKYFQDSTFWSNGANGITNINLSSTYVLKYTSDFTSSVDGWEVCTDGILSYNVDDGARCTGTPKALDYDDASISHCIKKDAVKTNGIPGKVVVKARQNGSTYTMYLKNYAGTVTYDSESFAAGTCVTMTFYGLLDDGLMLDFTGYNGIKLVYYSIEVYELTGGDVNVTGNLAVGNTTTNVTITDEDVTAPAFKITPEGGYAVKMIAGCDLEQGDVVRMGWSNGTVTKTTTIADSVYNNNAIGVVYANADSASSVWVVTSGKALVKFSSTVFNGDDYCTTYDTYSPPKRGYLAAIGIAWCYTGGANYRIDESGKAVSVVTGMGYNTIGIITETKAFGESAYVILSLQNNKGL